MLVAIRSMDGKARADDDEVGTEPALGEVEGEFADERRRNFDLHILTCGPNKAMGEMHERMPVILDEADWPKWLDEEPSTEDELMALLNPRPGLDG